MTSIRALFPSSPNSRASKTVSTRRKKYKLFTAKADKSLKGTSARSWIKVILRLLTSPCFQWRALLIWLWRAVNSFNRKFMSFKARFDASLQLTVSLEGKKIEHKVPFIVLPTERFSIQSPPLDRKQRWTLRLTKVKKITKAIASLKTTLRNSRLSTKGYRFGNDPLRLPTPKGKQPQRQ